jgi:type IV fimbrial biogenesis protein FimT
VRDVRAPPPDQCLQRGTSLIEQIMVLVIVASLACVATPSLRKLMARNQVQAAQNDFIGALQGARGTAITSGRQTLFCPSIDGAHCSEGLRWESGWLLARDANHDNQPDDAPLYSGGGYAGKLAIQSSKGRRLVRFHPDGSASGSNLTLLFCSPGNPQGALSVVVANSGRIRGARATRSQIASCAELR